MDQRRYPRLPVRFQSSFSSVNRIGGDGNIVDLSLRGCGIVSSTAVHTGTTLELHIHLPDHEVPLIIQQGVVRWCRDGRIGLEFLSLQLNEWTLLQSIVKELTRQPYERTDDAQNGTGT
ncbi:MAG: PilZ domain-containing protein [Nitrospira sp.]